VAPPYHFISFTMRVGFGQFGDITKMPMLFAKWRHQRVESKKWC